MALYPVAGSRIYIGPQTVDQTDDFEASDFAGLSFVEIDGWQTMGSVGDTAALISTDLINRGRTTKQKGTFNAGSMQNTFAIIAADAGQLALIAASKVRDNYAFKILLQDGSVRYFIGLVMSAQEAGGGANTIQTLNASIEINSNVVTVAAT